MATTYRAELNITGICALAFDPDEKACTILLVRATDPAGTFPSLPAADLPAKHRPYLSCLYEQLDLDRTKLSYCVIPGPDGRALALFDISEQDLTLKVDDQGGLSQRASLDATSFSHVIPLLDLRQGSTFRRECFETITGSSPVIARLRIDQGDLFTKSLGQEGGRQVWCEFKSLDESVTSATVTKRPVADFVGLMLPAVRGPLELVASDSRRIVIKAAAGGVVSFSLTNFDALIDDPAEERVLDYLWYYRLLDPRVASLGRSQLIVPFKTYPVLTALTPSSSVCPPGSGRRADVDVDVAATEAGLEPPAPVAASRQVVEGARRSLRRLGRSPGIEIDLKTTESLNRVFSRLELLIDRGIADARSDFPHCVAFGKKEPLSFSAILWAPDVVITAAHLVNQARKGQYTIRVVGAGAADGLYLTVEDAIEFHPNYFSESYCNDLAVLLLEKEVGLAPVPRAETTEVNAAKGRSATVVGFGEDRSEGEKAGNRQFGTVEITEVNFQGSGLLACVERHELVIRPKDARTGAGACAGDSGGSVYLGTGSARKLAAMVSRFLSPADHCRGPAVCVRLDYYAEWIDETSQRLRVKFQGERG